MAIKQFTKTTMPVGGGAKKIIYAMQTIRHIGVKKTQKALMTKNTCKACGLGMGGQRGGMTNELGEFPAVCNIKYSSTIHGYPTPYRKRYF